MGPLADTSLGLPAGLPVHAGCGDTQVAALGAGGLGDGVVTVVAGSSTPVQAATAAAPTDPEQHPWASTHARSDRWAVETNAGYPGSAEGWLGRLLDWPAPSGVPGAAGLTAVTGSPLWSEETWAVKPPVTVLGLRPDTPAR